MKTIETTTEIAATPDEIWAVLTDFERYSEWNPFITAAEGAPRVGERLRIRIHPPEGRAMTFKPTVTAAVPGERLAWLGRLGVRGLFDGRHEFRIDPLADGRTQLVQRETFSGILTGLLLNEARIRNGFEAMNDALKLRAEATSTADFRNDSDSVAA